jgi:hypothetical protein
MRAAEASVIWPGCNGFAKQRRQSLRQRQEFESQKTKKSGNLAGEGEVRKQKEKGRRADRARHDRSERLGNFITIFEAEKRFGSNQKGWTQNSAKGEAWLSGVKHPWNEGWV